MMKTIEKKNTKETREEIKALTNHELQQIKGGDEEEIPLSEPMYYEEEID